MRSFGWTEERKTRMGDTVGIDDINGGIMTEETALYLMEEAIFQRLKKKKTT